MSIDWGDLIGGVGTLAAGAAPFFGGDGGDSDAQGSFISSNPAAGFLANLFGVGAGVNKGGIQFREGGPFNFGRPIFNRRASNKISNYLNMKRPTLIEKGLQDFSKTGSFSSFPGEIGFGINQYLSQADALLNQGGNTLFNMLGTGMPVSIDPLIAQANARYDQNFLPTLAERYNPMADSGFTGLAARERALIDTELGAKQYESENAARDRMLSAITQGLPAYSTASLVRGSAPIAFLKDLTDLSGDYSAATQPGARLYNALLQLTGAGGMNNPITYGVNPESNTAALAGAIAEAVPAIISSTSGGDQPTDPYSRIGV